MANQQNRMEPPSNKRKLDSKPVSDNDEEIKRRKWQLQAIDLSDLKWSPAETSPTPQDGHLVLRLKDPRLANTHVPHDKDDELKLDETPDMDRATAFTPSDSTTPKATATFEASGVATPDGATAPLLRATDKINCDMPGEKMDVAKMGIPEPESNQVSNAVLHNQELADQVQDGKVSDGPQLVCENELCLFRETHRLHECAMPMEDGYGKISVCPHCSACDEPTAVYDFDDCPALNPGSQTAVAQFEKYVRIRYLAEVLFISRKRRPAIDSANLIWADLLYEHGDFITSVFGWDAEFPHTHQFSVDLAKIPPSIHRDHFAGGLHPAGFDPATDDWMLLPKDPFWEPIKDLETFRNEYLLGRFDPLRRLSLEVFQQFKAAGAFEPENHIRNKLMGIFKAHDMWQDDKIRFGQSTPLIQDHLLLVTDDPGPYDDVELVSLGLRASPYEPETTERPFRKPSDPAKQYETRSQKLDDHIMYLALQVMQRTKTKKMLDPADLTQKILLDMWPEDDGEDVDEHMEEESSYGHGSPRWSSDDESSEEESYGEESPEGERGEL
jgi:hypothetical protein